MLLLIILMIPVLVFEICLGQKRNNEWSGSWTTRFQYTPFTTLLFKSYKECKPITDNEQLSYSARLRIEIKFIDQNKILSRCWCFFYICILCRKVYLFCSYMYINVHYLVRFHDFLGFKIPHRDETIGSPRQHVAGSVIDI